MREVIGRRLNRLSDQCNQVLTTASIIGREFEFGLLGSLMGDIGEDQLLGAVDEASAARLIEEAPNRAERFQFSHALVQQTLAEEVTTTRRVGLHARIGEALEEHYGADADSHAAELARHFGESQTVAGSEKLVYYSLLAGEQALAAFAYEDAVAHFENGLAARDIALEGTEAAADDEAAALLFGLARARSATVVGHRLVEAFANLRRAYEYYAEAGKVDLAVAAAEFPISGVRIRISGVAELLARALDLVPVESHESGRLLSRYGGILGDERGDYEGAQDALSRAISIARREGDVALEGQGLGYAAAVSAAYLRWRESVDHGLRAIDLNAGDENPLAPAVHRWWAAVSLLRIGDLDAARPHALILRDRAEKRGASRLSISMALAPITTLSCLEGGWKAGREDSGRGLEASPLNPHPLLPRILMEHETGESAQGDIYLERLLEAMRAAGPDRLFAADRVSLAIASVARITGIPDHFEIAEAAAQAVLKSNETVTPVVVMLAKTGLVLLAVQTGDQTAAEEHYAYLVGLEQQSTFILTVSSVDRLLGLLSQTTGSLEQAADHFEDALAFSRKAGCRPELAWTCCDYADLLTPVGDGPSTSSGRTDVDRRTKAIALLEESLSIATELGMPPIMARANERLELVQALPQVSPAYPDGLSEREVQVLRLIASGKTNSEIAEELVIAEGTARRHVANIYEKIGAANRAEATRYTLRERLVSLDEPESTGA